jgi:hypothetical protein
MSKKFTKAEAEKLGWAFYHEAPEILLRGENPTGNIKTKPAEFAAEKYVNDSLEHEMAENEGQLLEKIKLYEEHLASRVDAEPEGAASVADAIEKDKRSDLGADDEQLEGDN